MSTAVDRGSVGCCGRGDRLVEVGRVVNMARRTMVRFFFTGTARVKTSGAESGKVRENIACRCAVTSA